MRRCLFGPAKMLQRMDCLQQRQRLADEALEDALPPVAPEFTFAAA